jgi:hypothetical protein
MSLERRDDKLSIRLHLTRKVLETLPRRRSSTPPSSKTISDWGKPHKMFVVCKTLPSQVVTIYSYISQYGCWNIDILGTSSPIHLQSTVLKANSFRILVNPSPGEDLTCSRKGEWVYDSASVAAETCQLFDFEKPALRTVDCISLFILISLSLSAYVYLLVQFYR